MRLLDYRGVKEEKGVPYSRCHLWRLVKAGRFPKPVKGYGSRSLNLWIDEEIDEHIKALIAERDGKEAVG